MKENLYIATKKDAEHCIFYLENNDYTDVKLSFKFESDFQKFQQYLLKKKSIILKFHNFFLNKVIF